MSGTTTRAALRYPGQQDAPNVAGDIQNLAEDVDAKLYRAFPCTNATKPVGLVAGDRGFLIDNSDTGNLERWNGSAWVVVGGAGGGGGGVTATEGIWTPSSAQSVGTALTVVAFGIEETASTDVVRSVSGAGHKFTFQTNGAYCVDVTLRFDAGNAGRRFCEVENAGQTIRYVAEGFTVNTGDTATVNLSRTKRFSAGEEIIVVANQTGQTSLPLVPTGATITLGFVRLSITRVAG